jgi:RNA polymerase sigma factor (sigma-70 family)
MCATMKGTLCHPEKNTSPWLFGCRLPNFRYADPASWAELQRLSDEQVMACLQKGQHDALAVLFDRYQKLVLSIALKIVRDPGEAEDVTQIVFLDIYRAVAQFDPSKGNTKVWLMQYAYHRAMNRRQHLHGREFYKNTETGSRTEDSCRGVALNLRVQFARNQGTSSSEYERLVRCGEEGNRNGLLRRSLHAGNCGAHWRFLRQRSASLLSWAHEIARVHSR